MVTSFGAIVAAQTTGVTRKCTEQRRGHRYSVSSPHHHSSDYLDQWSIDYRGCSHKYLWPSRMNAGAWNPKGIPYGGRMRIKQSWWDANADQVLGVKTQARVVGEALRRYGVIVADGTGGSSIEMCGVADMRWEKDFVQRLNRIPVSAF
jgi:hypothetical protein